MPERKTALVTGASRGIGKEIALELARNGYRVAVNYYNDPASMVEETIAEIRSLHASGADDVLALQADIRWSAQVKAMFEKAISAFGHLDLLVNNAESKPGNHFSKSLKRNGISSSTQTLKDASCAPSRPPAT